MPIWGNVTEAVTRGKVSYKHYKMSILAFQVSNAQHSLERSPTALQKVPIMSRVGTFLEKIGFESGFTDYVRSDRGSVPTPKEDSALFLVTLPKVTAHLYTTPIYI